MSTISPIRASTSTATLSPAAIVLPKILEEESLGFQLERVKNGLAIDVINFFANNTELAALTSEQRQQVLNRMPEKNQKLFLRLLEELAEPFAGIRNQILECAQQGDANRDLPGSVNIHGAEFHAEFNALATSPSGTKEAIYNLTSRSLKNTSLRIKFSSNATTPTAFSFRPGKSLERDPDPYWNTIGYTTPENKKVLHAGYFN